MDTVLEVLKWIAIVFAAGVVGQFGKSLTLRLLAARRRRAEASAADPAAVGPTPAGEMPSKAEHKRRKKELKAELKRRKKER